MNSPRYLDKVTAFITRVQPETNACELLLFIHPNAGIQIPAGTVEEGEDLQTAVLRETAEETGLLAERVRIRAVIGWRAELPPCATHVVLHKTRVYSRPDLSSFDWAEFRRGIGVRCLREEDGFCQVSYEEPDRYPDTQYTSYQITGWVPRDALADANHRHFFHLELTEPAPDRWNQSADHNTFALFWAPLDDLPQIVYPQNTWLEYVQLDLGYSFDPPQP
jgi:8-oxo-dGTP pyrophosphatase MutT (NUDIX family)